MILKKVIIHGDTKNYQRFTGVVAEAKLGPNFWVAALRGERRELLHEGYIYIYSNLIRRLIPAEIPAFGNQQQCEWSLSPCRAQSCVTV